MDKHFEIILLEEAFEYLSGLERKHYEKILYNIRMSQIELDGDLFKSCQMTFGSLEHFIKVFNIECLPFGTRLRRLKY